MTARLTIATVKAELAGYGITFRKTDAGDYRIAYRPAFGATRAQLERIEATSAYTDDLTDALGTGRMMAAHRASHPEAYADHGAWN